MQVARTGHGGGRADDKPGESLRLGEAIERAGTDRLPARGGRPVGRNAVDDALQDAVSTATVPVTRGLEIMAVSVARPG